MQMLTILFVQFWFTFFGTTTHDYHVLISLLEQKEEQIQITHKVFYDDLEQAILLNYNKEVELDVALTEEAKLLVQQYCQANFTIEINGKIQETEWIGQELDNELFYTYSLIPKAKRVKELTINNRLLLTTFDDQANIVHTKINGEKDSFYFRSGKETHSTTYE